ncbi:MAG: VOC family protein [Balneolaceae bacterium]
MNSLTPYIFFPGNCEEAMNFYKGIFNGKMTSFQRFGDANMPVEDDYKDKIMHAEMAFNGTSIMFSDGAPHKGVNPGDTIHLNLSFDNEASMRSIFNQLAEGGSVHMDLQDTFWGAIFGQLEDKFGIRWMFNHQKEA